MNMMTGTVRGRKNNYSEDEDLIILKEVCTSKAYIGGYVKIHELFSKSVDRANLNPYQTRKHNFKSIKNRYKKIQNKKDSAERGQSGLGG